MAKAKKLPSGSWRCQVSLDGKRYSFTATTKVEAEFLALEFQTERKEKDRPENRTVRQAVNEYIEGRSNILSPTTLQSYHKIERLYFGGIMDKKLAKVKQTDVQKEINTLAGKLSPKTVKNAWGLLRPACGFKFDVTLPRKEKIKYKTPDVEGIKFILQATKGTTIEVPVLLALWCGLRMSEIRGLQWSHIFPDHIYIEWAMVDTDDGVVLKKPKTCESEREIGIPPYLYDRIMEVGDHSTKYVTQMSSHAIFAKFKRLTNSICRFHDLRHANASVMMLLGVPDVYAMERGGWETESIYKKTYSQALPEGKKQAEQSINDFFSSLAKFDAHETAHEKGKDLLQ